ncbi:hypothetical protein CHISP_2758 [Chitinispirillum alkaliphilum]|nr:hypothetical protein CHISP_2758 [Chitinispirillum alkaliphilum]
MKKEYEKPEVFTEDISLRFVGACCEGSTDGMIPGHTHAFLCGPACTYVYDDYHSA